ncbi:Formate hydrogenlyase subunit 4 [Desulfotomaculum arcticum]|uniref:Formate hydrogenlyase subunit 4 n=1 Tax=Desulfotruncus arcticus DSM 17038 TaxID=1121424 RepID=A0A1I2YQR7_9FIRM|nr:complex I subunit 1 family protein [Desulfotruncus arcticus]SFH27947.1 Formate hydrogenlyase subunit 4 [Desulfotomaculum arcticum] [Desulfotruncus arcticus DSM 17038]
MIWNNLFAAVLALVFAPLIGGLLVGIDRKITARLQGRMGPPLLQPFYDFFKLANKAKVVTTRGNMIWAWSYLLLTMTAFTLFFLGQDLVVIFLMLAFAGGALAYGALSVRSPYSHFGAQRELIQMLSYEPILLLTAVAIALQAKTFTVEGILGFENPLLPALPLVFVAVTIALGIKMRKSPFDIAASEHAHQELVRGVYTEYAGPYLALIHLAHWYELILILAFIALFWAQPLWIGIAVALAAFLLELFIDNLAARLRWSWMVAVSWGLGVGFIMLNMALLQWLA